MAPPSEGLAGGERTGGSRPFSGPKRREKHGHASSRSTEDAAAAAAATDEERAARRARIDAERRALPVWAAKERLLSEVRSNPVLIIVGETGSGKTTQIPQFLLEAGLAGGGGGGAKRWKRHHGGDGGGGQSWGPGFGGGGGGGGLIAVTQPRRVAAVTVARRVADEMGVRLGQEVGYSIRFDDVTSPATRIKYMTDGMLLRECLLDPLLSKYSVVIVDEAHERTVSTDVLLGLLKGVAAARQKRQQQGQQQQEEEEGQQQAQEQQQKQQQRQGGGGSGGNRGGGGGGGDPFRLIVMSATLDAEAFSRYFGGARAVWVRGRQHPVQVMCTTHPEDNYLDAALNAVLQVHCEEGPGDILVFLTGQEEIEGLERLLMDRAAALPEGAAGHGGGPGELLVLPIYAALPPEQQMRVFDPAPEGTRKAILATNIAETSITIPGVKFVIDTGFVKARGYHAKLGADSLQVVPVSQAQARQRSGRAGREGPGKAFRLYTLEAFQALAPTTPPEILRSNLASTVLQLKALGVADVLGFDFMDKPPTAAIVRSLELLLALGALDSSGALTEAVGAPMARLPVDPMFGKVLLASAPLGCAVEAMQVVGMVSSDGIFYNPRNKREEVASVRAKFVSPEGDHLTALAVVRAYLQVPRKQRAAWASDNFVNLRSIRKALDIYDQLEGHLSALGLPIKSCGADPAPLQRALASGLFPHAARRLPEGGYRVIATGQTVFLHPSSVLCGKKPECVVFNELVRTTKQYAREVCRIEPAWLPELAPAFFAAKAGAAAGAVERRGGGGGGGGSAGG